MRLIDHVTESYKLAWPVVVTRTGIMTMELIDIVMVGQYATSELAYLSIGIMPYMPVFLVLLGLVMGTVVVTATAFGSGKLIECGAAWRRSLPYGLGLGIIGAVFSQLGEPVLLFGGQSEELAHHGGRIMAIIGMGLPAYMITITSTFFLEGIKRAKPVAVIIIVSNVLNIALNWMLVYGNFGMPALGAEGSAIATVIIRWTGCFVILGYILNMKDHHVFGVRLSPRGGWRAWAEQRQFGYSAAVSIGVESVSFSTVGMFAGWLGKSTLAAYSITHNLIALVFMVALGFGSSTTVRVGFFRGRVDRLAQQIAGWTGLTLNTVAMLAIGIVFVSSSTVLASAYSSDPVVIAIAAPLITFCAIVIMADGGQAVMVHALRGCGDKWAPPLIQSASYLLIMIPLAWWLAIDRGGGVIGIFHAMLTGSAISFVLLSVRFYRTR